MCCGGKSGKPLRKMQVQRSAQPQKQVAQRRIADNKSVANASIPKTAVARRQALVKDDKCPKCSRQIILVNIAGRDRKQCISCKHILR